MTARRLGLIVALLGLAAGAARAVDTLDTLSPAVGTQPVALMGGDTPGTYQVSCSSNTLAAGATLLRPAVAADTNTNQAKGRPLRNRCFQNASSAEKVNIGSSTVATSDFYVLGESTNAATSPTYCTHSSGAVYCAPASPATAAATVNVYEETQSVP